MVIDTAVVVAILFDEDDTENLEAAIDADFAKTDVIPAAK